MGKHTLFYSPPMAPLAREIAERYSEIVLGEIDFKRFPDGSPNTLVHRANQLVTEHVAFLACFENWNAFFEQLSTHYHLAGLSPKSYRVIMPFFNTATMERSTNEGQIITAKTLLQAMGAISSVGPGVVPVYTYDVHALAIRSFVGPNLVLRFKTGLKLLFNELETRGDVDKLIVAFPDEGARKRFGEMEALLDAKDRLGFKIAVCGKNRIGNDDRKLTLQEGDVNGCDVVMIDDLLRSGKTLFECAKVMLGNGARACDAYSTHVGHEDGGWRKFDGHIIRRLYMTNSCPATTQAVRGNPNVIVFNLADSIANAIRE